METKQVLGGRYRLETQLGSGGMAVVWRAHDQVLSRDVAVKVLAGRHATHPDARERIHREARSAASLSHPNIAQVYDFGESDDDGTRTAYVVMELVPGGTLEQRLRAGPLPVKVAFRICAEVAAGLAAAHAHGLVHRDVKPANIMMTPNGAKVVDFGIAAAARPDGAGDPEEELLGTPSYLAPERLTGDSVQPATDVYALGVLLYKLLAGRAPWDADTTTKMLTAHVYTEPAPLPALPNVPGDVIDLCHHCLRKDPAQRPGARDVAAILAGAAGVLVVEDDLAHTLAPPAVDGEPSAVLVPGPAPVAAATTTAVRRRRVRQATAVMTAVAAAILLWLFIPVGQPQPGSQAAPPGPLDVTGPPAADVTTAPTAGGLPGQPTSTPAGTGSTVTGLPGAQPGGPVGTVGTPPAGPGQEPTAAAPTTGAQPVATTAAAPPPPGPQQRTLSSTGGSVTATCTPTGSAQLLSWTPTKPYKVERVDPGPAPAAVVAFRHGNDIVQMAVTCTGGIPSASTANLSK